MAKDAILLVNLSGRGDKDVISVRRRSMETLMSPIAEVFSHLKNEYASGFWSPT